jgi:linoleoyl-CoA desaturase
LHKQYGQALRTIWKLSLPNKMTSSDQPEPPTPIRDRRRLTDAERPVRRPETGAYTKRASA